MPVSALPGPDSDALTAALHREQARRAQAEARVAELEQQLADSQATSRRHHTRLASLVQNLRIGFMLVDDNGMVELVNQRYCELFGIEDPAHAAQPTSGMAIAARIRHNFHDPEAYLVRAAAIRQAGHSVLNEELLLTDGRVLERDYIVLDSVMAGRLVCYRDVTARHRREAQLRTASLIAEQNPNPVLRLAASGELLYANPAATTLTQAMTTESALQARLLALVTTALATTAVQQQEIGVGGQYFLLQVTPMPQERYATLYLVDITARRHAEQQLAEQRAFYEVILRELPVGVSVFDAEHRYLFANPGVAADEATRRALLGKTNAEATALRQRPAAVAERREQLFGQAVAERRDVQWEEAVAEPGGTRHVLRRFHPVFDETDGRLRLMVAYGLDVTERYRAEQQLTEQREFYETILNELPADIGVFDRQHRYLYVNPVGIKNPEVRAWIIGKDHFEYCAYRQRPIEMAEQRKQLFDEVIRHRRRVTHEETVDSPQGPRRMLRLLQPVLDAAGEVRLIVAYGLDITDRHQAEQQVNEQQEFIHQIVNTSPNILYVTDESGQAIFSNAAFKDLLAQSHHQQTDPADDTPEAAELRQLLEWNQVVIATDEDVSGEISFTLATGEVLQLQIAKRPLLRPHGGREVLTVGTDVTELKRARREAEAAATARENFLANMSHEIRTPMNGVLGMAGLLTRTPLNAQQQEYVAIIRHSGTHLLGLLNDILDVAKITSGKLELEQIPFDLNQTLQAVGQTIGFQATGKGLAFRTEPVGLPQPAVCSDPQRLRQVLLNLLSNSLKFTERGTITLSARLLAETADTLTVAFRVTDTGLGVPADKQETIFSTFTQAYADTSRRFGGSGLGLSISSSLVAQLGGHLLMCSEPGTGTSFGFTLTLPKASAEALAAAQQPTDDDDMAAATQAMRGLRVLLVEDNDVNRQLAELVLASYEVTVETANDGAAALALFEQNVYDVILMDIQMPGMNGLEATARIRRHPDVARAQTPIIALTANAFLADNEKYLAAGMNDCLAKPFEAAELMRKIGTLHRADPRPAHPLFALDELRRTARGNPVFVRRILESFLTHTPPVVAQLQEAVAAPADWSRAAALAHRIKPSLKLLMAHELLPAILLLENTAAPAPARAEAARQLLALLPRMLWQLQHHVANEPADAAPMA